MPSRRCRGRGRKIDHHLVGAVGPRGRTAEARGRVRRRDRDRGGGAPDSLGFLPGPGVPQLRQQADGLRHRRRRQPVDRPRRHQGPLPRADRLVAAARRHRGDSPARAPLPDGVSPGKRQVLRGPLRDRRPRLRVPPGLVRGPCRAGGVRGEVRPRPAAPRHLAGVPRGRRVLPPPGGEALRLRPADRPRLRLAGDGIPAVPGGLGRFLGEPGDLRGRRPRQQPRGGRRAAVPDRPPAVRPTGRG